MQVTGKSFRARVQSRASAIRHSPVAEVLFVPADRVSRRMASGNADNHWAKHLLSDKERRQLARQTFLARKKEIYPEYRKRAEEAIQKHPELISSHQREMAARYQAVVSIPNWHKNPDNVGQTPDPNVLEKHLDDLFADFNTPALPASAVRYQARVSSSQAARKEMTDLIPRMELAKAADRVGLGVNIGLWVAGADTLRRIIRPVLHRLRNNPNQQQPLNPLQIFLTQPTESEKA